MLELLEFIGSCCLVIVFAGWVIFVAVMLFRILRQWMGMERLRSEEADEDKGLTSTLPEFAPVQLTGTNDEVVNIQKPPGPAILHIKGNEAGRHFAIWSLSVEGKLLDLLVSVSEAYEGTVPIDFEKAHHTARLEISAQGPWNIELWPLSVATPGTPPCVITGSDDDFIMLRGGKPDLVKAVGNEAGRYFRVSVYSRYRYRTLVSSTEPYEGTNLIPSDMHDKAWLGLEVHAVGEWTIEVTVRK